LEQSDYKLIRQVGAGISGAVWMADGPAGQVAMRQFASPAQPGSEEWLADRAHFLQAARQGLTFRSPRVVPVLDVIDDSDDAWVASEFVEDDTVESLLSHERLSVAQANRILRGAALALDQAHKSGIVHGDLRPSNIFVGKKSVRVSDFAFSPRARRSPRTEWSPDWIHPFIAPEHLIAPGTIGPRSDVYALAAIGYYMYTGKLPFSSSGDVRAAILRGQLDSPATVSRVLQGGLEVPLRKAMSRDPGLRFANCSEMIGALEAGAGSVGSVSEEEEKGGAANKLIYVGIGSLILAMAVATFLLFHHPAANTETAAKVVPAAASGPIAPTGQAPVAADLKSAKKTKAPVAKVLDSDQPLARSQSQAETSNGSRHDPFPKPEPKTVAPPQKQTIPSASSVFQQAGNLLQPKPTREETPVSPEVYTKQQKGYSLLVYSRKVNDPKHLIGKGISFKFLDPELGEMASGDLKAMVLLNGVPPPGKNQHLSVVWKVDGTPMDAHFVSPNTVTEFGSEPIAGTYDVMLMLDKDLVAEYTFRITR